jgi:hypothetical protein
MDAAGPLKKRGCPAAGKNVNFQIHFIFCLPAGKDPQHQLNRARKHGRFSGGASLESSCSGPAYNMLPATGNN